MLPRHRSTILPFHVSRQAIATLVLPACVLGSTPVHAAPTYAAPTLPSTLAPALAWTEDSQAASRSVSLNIALHGVSGARRARVTDALEQAARAALAQEGVTVTDNAPAVLSVHVRDTAQNPSPADTLPGSLHDYGTHLQLHVDGQPQGEPDVTFCDQQTEQQLVACALQPLRTTLAQLPAAPEPTQSSTPASTPNSTSEPPNERAGAPPIRPLRAEPRLWAGVGLSAVGVGLLATGIALHLRNPGPEPVVGSDREGAQRDQHARALTIPLMAAGATTLLAGSVLVALGVRRHRAQTRPTTALSPLLTPHAAGLSLQGSF